MTNTDRGALKIRRAEAGDLDEWMRMRAILWPDCPAATHREEMKEYLRNEAGVAFVAARPTRGIAGFVEATVRPYAECCETRPVGYIEGWYVDADVRRQGVGERLVRAAEVWARTKKMREMASDCPLDNDVSRRAHIAIGYEEKERLIHFRKWLSPRQPRTNR